MISKFFAFTDLVKPENLKKIKIDTRIVPTFVSLMHKMQKHFEQKGYLNANNYALFFEEYLLTKNDNQYSIKFSSDMSANVEGFYNNVKKVICVNEKFYQTVPDEKIEEVIYHEFIHFLAKTDVPFIEQQDGSFVKSFERYVDESLFCNSFMIEAFTESMTQKLFPKSNSYRPQVKMIEFSNYIHKTTNNYFLFLRGQIPGVKKYSTEFEDFKAYVKLYNTQEYNNGFSMSGAEKNSNYMHAQRLLTQIFAKNVREEIKTFSFKNIFEYVQRVGKIVELEPVKTKELEYLVEDLNNEFLNQYFRFSIITQKDKSVSLMKLNQLMGLYEKVYTGASDIYKNTNSYFSTKVEVFEKEMAIYFNNQKILFKKSPNQYKSLTFTYINAGIKTPININVSIYNNELYLSYGAPLNINHKYDISFEKHNKSTENLKNDIDEIEKYFSTFKTQKYQEIRNLFKKDKDISKIYTVCFPDSLMQNANENFYVTQGIYEEKKFWFMEDGILNFATLNNCKSKFMSRFLAEKKLSDQNLTGLEFGVENKQFFAYEQNNEYSVAKIGADGKLIPPVKLMEIYDENEIDLFDEKYLKLLKLNSKNDKVFNY